MKKILFMLLAMLPMLILTSCSSDEDENGTIVGTWFRTSDEGVEETTYNEDGTMSQINTYKNGEKEEFIGKYSISGKSLTYVITSSKMYKPDTFTRIEDHKTESLQTKFSIIGNTLKFKRTNKKGRIETVTFTRKRL